MHERKLIMQRPQILLKVEKKRVGEVEGSPLMQYIQTVLDKHAKRYYDNEYENKK